jgi:hypothetical protein|tara:strand:+ start:429 stop:614 length:186 start_codon:yes stop_codon:yes gene_type:complete
MEELKKCVDCKKLISKSAKTCPKCGSSRPHPLPPLTALMYLIVIFLVFGLFIWSGFSCTQQ